MAFGNIGTIWAEIGLNTAKLQAGVSTAKLQLSALDRQAMTQTASINAKLNKIGAGLTSVGKNMSKFVTLPLLAVGVAATKAGMDFEDGMTKSLAIMNNVTPQIRSQMELTAKDVIKYTTFSAKEAADAYFYLASAGLDAAQSIEALPRVAKFAQAGNFNLALATDLLTDAQSALGLTIRDDVVKNMENMTRVSDVLVKANTLSNATVQQFSESLTNKAGAAMKMLNMDIEEGVAMLAAWADQGVKGSEAGNYLNIVLRDLQRATIENEEVFNKFNISVFDSSGNVRNMADVIGDLETALDGMSDKEKRATLMTLGFQDRSISAMMSLLGTSDSIRQYEKDLRSAAGYTDEVAKKQMESFTAQMKQLKNELINVGISIFDILKPRLESLIEAIKKGIDWFNSLTDSQKKLIVNFGIFAAAIGPVLIGLGSITRAVVTLRTAMLSLAVATKLAYGELALIGALIAQLGIQAVTYTDGIKKAKEGTQSWGEALFNLIPVFGPAIYALRRAMEGTEELTEAQKESTKANIAAFDPMNIFEKQLDKTTITEIEAKIAAVDHENAIQGLMTQYDLTEEAAEEYYNETEEGTGIIEDQTESVDDLRSSFNSLISTLFDGINASNELQEAEWEQIAAQKAVNKLIKDGKEGTQEYEQAINDLDSANQSVIESLYGVYTSTYTTKEEQEEARKKALEYGQQLVISGQWGEDAFIEMAQQFGLSGNEIILKAQELGIKLDEATKDRLVNIDVDISKAETNIEKIQRKINSVQGKSVEIITRMITTYAGGGIVKAMAGGGVVGNDGARQPILSAAYGMVTPQTGRVIPVLAHENEIIANTSQQRNLAEWIMGKANTRPNTTISKNEVILHIPLSLDGKILYDVWEKYDLREGARKVK